MEQSVDIIIKETITEHVNVDQALNERIRKLVDKALDNVEDILDFGLAGEKMQVIRTLLSASTRQLGKDFTQTENEARLALERIFENQRQPIEASDALELKPIAPRVDDSDERSNHREVPD